MVDQVANQCYRAKHQGPSALLWSCKCRIFMPKGLSRTQTHLCSRLQLSSLCEHPIRSLELVTAATACAQQDTNIRSKKHVNEKRINIRPQRPPTPPSLARMTCRITRRDWTGLGRIGGWISLKCAKHVKQSLPYSRCSRRYTLASPALMSCEKADM